jgi:hypothetical protein
VHNIGWLKYFKALETFKKLKKKQFFEIFWVMTKFYFLSELAFFESWMDGLSLVE